MSIVLDGTTGITTPDLTDTSLTSGRVVYAGTGGNLTGSANLTFDGSNLGVGNANPRTLFDTLSGTANTTGDVLGQAIITGPDFAPAATGGSGNLVIQSNSNQAANVGGTIALGGRAVDASTVGRAYAVIKGAKENSTSANRDGYFAIFTRSEASGQSEKARFNSTGAMVFAGGTTTANGIGITFPATQSASSDANTLDDYEEGTWTPAPSTGAWTVNLARYTKIGRQVTCIFDVTTTVGGTGTNITGLPFTPSGNSAGVVGYQNWDAAVWSIYVEPSQVSMRVGPTVKTLGNATTAIAMFTYNT